MNINDYTPIPNFNRYLISDDGIIFSTITKRILKPYWNKTTKKWNITLMGENGRIFKNLKIHILVAITHIPNPKNYPCVLHQDDNPHDNHWSNLRWGTKKMNTQDMIDNDKRVANFKFGKDIHDKIIKLRALGKSQKRIAELVGTTQGSVSRILLKYN